MTKVEMLEKMKQARNLLDDVYYMVEGSENNNLKEIERLMSWCDTCIMDAEIEVETYFGE